MRPVKEYTRWQSTLPLVGGGAGGDAEKTIREYALKDSRIKYLGTLSINKVRQLQKNASLLINPRHSWEEFTKYSFPSKTMEYMASGTPTLMNRLECIPKEYYQHLYFFNNDSVRGFISAILSIYNKPLEERIKKGENAAEYIKNNKSAKIQVAKIINLIQTVSQNLKCS